MARSRSRSRSKERRRRDRDSPDRRRRERSRERGVRDSVSPKRRRRERSTERSRDRDSSPPRRRNRSAERKRSPPRRRRSRSRSGSNDRRNRDRSPKRSPTSKGRREIKEEPLSPSSSTGGQFRIASLLKKPDPPRKEPPPFSKGDQGFDNERPQKWGRPEMYEKKEEEVIPPEQVEKPNFAPSGKLAEDTNMFKGVVIKYNEPPEARIPKGRWRLYPFRGDDQLDVLYIHRQSAFMISREKKLGDILVEHPSCSKQHAVLQYRCVPYVKADGSKARRVLPYIIDLGSANGTFLNGTKIEPQRYYELKENDMLKFGFSSRDFLIMKEKSEKELEAATANKEDGADSDDSVSSSE